MTSPASLPAAPDASAIASRNERIDPPATSRGLLTLFLSGLSWTFAGGFCAVSMALMLPMFRWRRPDQLNAIQRFYCRWQLWLTGSRTTCFVSRAIDNNRPYMFLQNHVSHLDHAGMYNATPHFKQGIELASHFDYPFYGAFMKARGSIPVPDDRKSGLLRALKSVRSEIEQGHSILAFPEGTRSLNGRVATFRDGLFYIAIKLGIPVVPVSVCGMWELLHKGELIVRPGQQITVRVHDPIETTGLTVDDVATLRDRVFMQIHSDVDAHWAAKKSSAAPSNVESNALRVESTEASR